MSDNIFKISKSNDLFQVLKQVNNKLIVIMFSADWCMACHNIKNDFYKFSEKYNNTLFIYIDVDKYIDKECPIITKVKNLPTFMFFINNNLFSLITGSDVNKLQQTIINGIEKINEPQNNFLYISEEKKLLQILNNNKNVIIMVSAVWCGPCKTIKPEFKKLSNNNKNIFFVYIDIDSFDEKECPIIDKVKSLPTFMKFNNNKLINTIEGANLEKLNIMVSDNNNYI